MTATSLKFTYHAIMEMREELQQDEMINETGRINDETIRNYIREYMSKATYLGYVTDGSGKQDRLYAYRRYCFVLDINEDVVITVYRRNIASDELRDLVKPLLFDKLREMDADIEVLEARYKKAHAEYKLEEKMYNALGKNGYAARAARSRRNKARSAKVFAQVERSKIAKGIALFI